MLMLLLTKQEYRLDGRDDMSRLSAVIQLQCSLHLDFSSFCQILDVPRLKQAVVSVCGL